MREAEMMEPLKQWLTRTRRVRDDTLIVEELPWLGRRVDLATLTHSGAITAYELKTKNTLKAIEQAAKNTHAFRRSYVVTAVHPSAPTCRTAKQVGVGILSYSGGRIRLIVSARQVRTSSQVTRRLTQVIQSRARSHYVQ